MECIKKYDNLCERHEMNSNELLIILRKRVLNREDTAAHSSSKGGSKHQHLFVKPKRPPPNRPSTQTTPVQTTIH